MNAPSFSGGRVGLRQIPVQEFEHQTADFVALVFEREMAGVEQVQFGIRQVPQVGTCAGGGKDFVVLAPYQQCRGLVLAEELVETRIEIDVGAVVVEKIELYFGISRTFQEQLVEYPGSGIEVRGIRDAMRILPTDAVGRDGRTQGIAMRIRSD